MNSKIRYIPLVVIGAIILSLLAVMPTFGEDALVEFYAYDADDPTDTDDEQTYTRQGGSVGIRLEDTDLDVIVKRLLIPDVDTDWGEIEVSVPAPSADYTYERAEPTVSETFSVTLPSGEATDKVNVTEKAGSKLPLNLTVTAGDLDTSMASEITLAGAVAGNATKGLYTVTLVASLKGTPAVKVEKQITILITEKDGTGVTTKDIKVAAASNEITVPKDAFDEGDTILVVGDDDDFVFTVREVDDRASDPDNALVEVLTVNTPWDADADNVTVYKVTATKGVYAECPDCAVAQQLSIVSGDPRTTTANTPLLDSGVSADRFTKATDGFVDENDILFIGSDGKGISTLKVNDARESGRVDHTVTAIQTDIYALYWAAIKNTTRDYVEVSSVQDSTGMSLVLEETTSTSGVFTALLETAAPLATDATEEDKTAAVGKLTVGEDDTITVDYSDPSNDDDDQEETIQVETTAPSFSGTSPSHGSAGRVERPEVEADVADSDSGIPNEKNLWVAFASDDDSDGDIDDSELLIVDEQGTVSSISGGYHVRVQPTSSLREEDATLYWWVLAEDAAGNIGVSDRVTQDDEDTEDQDEGECDGNAFFDTAMKGDFNNAGISADGLNNVDVDESDTISGCQPYKIVVDNSAPKLTGAFTGQFWDIEKVLKDDETDRTNTDATEADPTIIRLEFDGAIDGGTVEASDFEVDGNTPFAASHYEGASSSVFLTVPTLDANDRPEIEIVGDVSDAAGNRRTSFKITSTDKVAPTLTVTIEGTASGSDRVVTDKEVTITVSSDEPASAPIVRLARVTNKSQTDEDEDFDDDIDFRAQMTKESSPVKGASRTWSAKFDLNEAGLYNVYVTAKDTSGGGNDGSAGDMKFPIDLDSDDSLLFEVDKAAPNFTVIPTSTDDPDAFITVDFTSEGTEYLAESGTGATKVDANDYDSYGSVTIVSASLEAPDGTSTDIKEALDKSVNDAGNKFRYQAAGLAVGEYKVKIKATDDAGNEDETAQTQKFEITERKPFTLELAPGWNLVSIPSDPEDSDINVVIPADHPIEIVITYDPSSPGGWLTSKRDPADDDKFKGSVMEITAKRAYWVLTKEFEDLKVNIPKPQPGSRTFLPTVTLAKEWNLVPIIDVDGNFKLDGKMKADPEDATKMIDNTSYNYFESVKDNVTSIYTFDTVNNTWTTISTDGSLDVMIGKGYWVFSNKSVTLVPQ